MNDAGFTEESWDDTADGPQGIYVSSTHRVTVTGKVGSFGEDIVYYEVAEL